MQMRCTVVGNSCGCVSLSFGDHLRRIGELIHVELTLFVVRSQAQYSVPKYSFRNNLLQQLANQGV